MSETPIGSIEFLVDFDNVGKDFIDALKEAIDKSDGGGVSKDLENDIKEIRFNVESRLRTPFSGDRLQFLQSVGGEITTAQSEKFINKLSEVLMASPTGKKYFGQRKEESEEDYGRRILETSKRMAGKYVSMMKEQIENPSAGMEGIIAQAQAEFDQILSGTVKSVSKSLINRLMDEKKDWEPIYKELMRELGVIVQPEGQTSFALIKRAFGKGKKGTISTQTELMDAILEMGLSSEQMQDVFQKGSKAKASLVEPMKQFFEDWVVEAGVDVPRAMMNTLIEKLKLVGRDVREPHIGIRPDAPSLILKEMWEDPERKKRFLDIFDDKESRERISNLLNETFQKSDVGVLLAEGKTLWEYALRLDEEARKRSPKYTVYSGFGGTPGPGAAAMTGPQFAPITEALTVETVKNATTTQIEGMRKDIVDLLETWMRGMSEKLSPEVGEAEVMILLRALRAAKRDKI